MTTIPKLIHIDSLGYVDSGATDGTTVSSGGNAMQFDRQQGLSYRYSNVRAKTLIQTATGGTSNGDYYLTQLTVEAQ